MTKKKSNIKTQAELQVMRELWIIHKIIFDEIKKHLKPWNSWYNINKLVWEMAKKYNMLCAFAWVYDFPWNLCISVWDCVVHWVPSKKMIFKEWDVVKIDFWLKDKKFGLNTDAAFSMIIWDWPFDLEVEKFLKITKEALYKWIAKATTWNRVWDIGSAIQKHIEKNWYHIVKDLTWHWIWYEVHEKPYIPNYWNPWTWEILRENMTLAIEPIVWFSSPKIVTKWDFNIHIEDWSIWAQFEHTIIVKSWYPEIIV